MIHTTMKQGRISAVCLLLLSVLIAAGWSARAVATEIKENVAIQALPGEISALDPPYMLSTEDTALGFHVYETLTRWDPFKDLLRIQERMNHMFEDSLVRSRGEGEVAGERGGWTPAVDIYETPDKVILLADQPGVAREDVDLFGGVEPLQQEARLRDPQRDVGAAEASLHAIALHSVEILVREALRPFEVGDAAAVHVLGEQELRGRMRGPE